MCDYVNAKFTRLARLLLRTLIPLTRVFIIPNHRSFRAPNFRQNWRRDETFRWWAEKSYSAAQK